MVSNADVARALHELAVLTELEDGGRNSFRARAYHRAVRSVEAHPLEVSRLGESELVRIDGIGPAIAKKIRELAETGSISRLEELRGRYPPGYLDLVRVPGIGPKTVALLAEHLGIRSLDDLKEALAAQRLRDLPGLGARTEEKLLRAIERLGMSGKERRTPIAEALPLAERLVGLLRRVDGVEKVGYAGSLRRFRETVADIDLVVATADAGAATEAFTRIADVREVLARGETKTTVLTARGIQVDLRVVTPQQWGAAMVYFTGSKEHNVAIRERAVRRGMTLNEYGLFHVADGETGERVAGAEEAEVYEALGLEWIPPGMRENVGEIADAEARSLPQIAGVGALRGDLHVHTDRSGDGHQTLEAVIEEASARGYAYLAITDHAENLPINAVTREEMLVQRAEIRARQETLDDLVLLHGAELNIGPDGGLDYDDDFLASFDWCVASVHSHFGLGASDQTARIVAAMEHPSVSAVGHLQGRRIGKRPGIEIDVEAVLDAAERTGTAIEINSHLDRLDASAEVLRAARDRDVVFVVNSDAHRRHEFDYVRHGIRQAERGWVRAERIANTWPRERFLAWVRR
jgi:DNA polymerase (family X)